MLELDQIIPATTLFLVAVVSNLPLGYLRESYRKYSIRWLICIHASIPFLIALRHYYGFNWQWIPLTLGCAVMGQLMGGWMRRRVKP